MAYANLIIIMGTLFFAYNIARANSRFNKNTANSKKQMMERESQANSVRRADISSLDYLIVPIQELFLEQVSDAGFSDLANELKALSEKKIINLSQYSNTDLKLMYGPANLEELSQYDNNYTRLITLLNKISTKLLEANLNDMAKAYLEYSVSIGSDITSTFVMLGELYAKSSDSAKLSKLIHTAEAITSLSGPGIVTKLNNIKSQVK